MLDPVPGPDDETTRRVQELFQGLIPTYRTAYPNSTLDFEALNLTKRLEQAKHPRVLGHFSDIYKGKLDDVTQVAVKVLRLPAYTPSEEDIFITVIRRFFRELNHWHDLKHLNVAEMCGYTLQNGMIGLVSPWYPNGDVVQYLKATKQASKPDLILDVAEGLQYLHTLPEQLIHSDIKARNIFVDLYGIARLGDFGISKRISDMNRKTGFTTSGGSLGTTPWTAPELLFEEGAKPTLASDIYACAGAFLEILCPGKIPYCDCNNWELWDAKKDGQPPDRKSYPELKDQNALWGLLAQCWSSAHNRPKIPEVTKILYAEFQLNPRVELSVSHRPASGPPAASNIPLQRQAPTPENQSQPQALKQWRGGTRIRYDLFRSTRDLYKPDVREQIEHRHFNGKSIWTATITRLDLDTSGLTPALSEQGLPSRAQSPPALSSTNQGLKQLTIAGKYYLHLHNMAKSKRWHMTTETTASGTHDSPVFTTTINVDGTPFYASHRTKRGAHELAGAHALEALGYDISGLEVYDE